MLNRPKPLVLQILDGFGLSDLAPAMLAILGVHQSAEMTGRSLLTAA
jgi:bisphosphoglycerate-independent phosphoglycerate mutase (AlkP superfamily)